MIFLAVAAPIPGTEISWSDVALLMSIGEVGATFPPVVSVLAFFLSV
jgi:hypothetical protein